MKKIKIFSLLLALFLLFSLVLPAYADETLPPEETSAPVADLPASAMGLSAGRPLTSDTELPLNVKAALLYEMNSGTMVYGYNIDMKLYPASLTKIMTCLVALKYGNLTDMVPFTESAQAGMHPDGSNVALQIGEKLSLEEMLYCVMLASANDACAALAEEISGSEEAFVELMNQEAQALGCTGTHFANSHGLHDENHYTTARDMLRIMDAALENDFFCELYSTIHHTVPASNLGGPRELSSTDLMRNKDDTTTYYDERVEGGKTGFTTPAGRCFVCTAREGDLHYISVVMGSENEIMDNGATVNHHFMDTESLLEFGFNEFSFSEALSPLVPLGQVAVAMSPDGAVVAPAETVSALLPNERNPEDVVADFTLDNPSLSAPLEAGQQIGTVKLYYKGTCIGEAPLVTMNAVRQQTITYLLTRTAKGLAGSPWRFAVYLLLGLLIVLLLLLLRAAILRRRYRQRRRRRRR